jgi:HD-GYP domain-containing protein (c-di-GMP phosphodiesterase class II)
MAEYEVKEGEIPIEVSQLRPGVHIRLPASWSDHSFLFNSFVISSAAQVKEIAALNLPQLFCDITKCKVPPLPRGKQPEPTITPGDKEFLAAEIARHIAAKRERVETMKEVREQLNKAGEKYNSAAKTVANAIRNFDADPKECIQQVSAISEESTRTLLADPNNAIVLIGDAAREDGSAAHSLSVMTLTLLVGKQARLPAKALEALGAGAMLHDIGKSGINTSILRNTDRNKHEQAIYEMHCRNGHESATRAGCLTKPILDAILYHHEHADGSGFPQHMKGNAIPVTARVVALTDRFDNLVNPLDFRKAISPSEALSQMWAKERDHFDSVMLQLFVKAVGVYPPGSIVQLTDDRIGAVVASAPTEHPMSPQVMIYDPDVPQREALIVDLTLEPSVKIIRSLPLMGRPDEELDYLIPRRKISWFRKEAG